MSMLREQLVRKALAALSEIADECGDRPACKTLSLRFVLMYTFAASGADPKNKWIWDSFWTAATRPKSAEPQDAYIRGTGARSALNGICREVGYPPDVAFLGLLRAQRTMAGDQERAGEPKPAPLASNDEPTENNGA